MSGFSYLYRKFRSPNHPGKTRPLFPAGCHFFQSGMETYTGVKPLVYNPGYTAGRKKAIDQLEVEIREGHIDPPIIDLLSKISKFPFCYTLQSCYGHFVHEKQTNDQNYEPLAPYATTISEVTWRIAYMAFCTENSRGGRAFCSALRELTTIDPRTIQIGCADWFRDQTVNSYVIQVSPERFRCQDSMVLSMNEALQVEHVRNLFYQRFHGMISAHRSGDNFIQ
jgi:hypothetical protein